MATRYNYTGGIVTNGLVLNLDAAKTDSYPGTGTTWRDLSGNGNNGTLTNGPTFNSANGGSIVFDGSNDYVIVNDSTSLNQLSGLTISAWVNKKTGAIRIAGKWADLKYNYIVREISGVLQFYIWTTSIAGGNIGITPIQGWNLYTCTWDGTTMRAYLNTTQSSTTYTKTGNISLVGANLIIGAQYDITEFTDQSMALMQIYNRALSATEILQNYNATKSRFGIL
jgi:hypothetical protein